MRPNTLKTRIFLDSGDPQETQEAIALLGFLDGQTTNPSLIAKNPNIEERLKNGETRTNEAVYVFYKQIVEKISSLIPQGSVSIEVYADANTTADEMFFQAQSMYSWIPNAHIKFPTTTAGLAAAERFVNDGGRVNMTLVFSQEQGAAVYAATNGAKKGTVFLSPFIGRLDDRGEDGMSLIENIIRMFHDSDHHVEVLVASVRSLDHFLSALQRGADIITAPLNILKEWNDAGKPVPSDQSARLPSPHTPIPYQSVDLNKDWHTYNISHELTDSGITRFAQDWNKLTHS